MRTDHVWSEVATAAGALLSALTSDDAMRASWDDLVSVAQNRSCDQREFRPIADLLFTQLQRRGLDAEHTLRTLVSVVAYGRQPSDVPLGELDTPFEDRLETARRLLATPVAPVQVVVWLGYKGRMGVQLSAGNVAFYDAHWTVPNAAPDRQSFDHKEELWSIVEHGFAFRIAERIDEESDIDTLVRVDLGIGSSVGAVQRAASVADTIISISIHRAGGVRPRLAEWVTVIDGIPGVAGMQAVWSDPSIPDDHYGARLTSDAIEEHGPRIAEALAQRELPRFLAAAIEVQTSLDRPFSRDMALRTPSEADITSVIPLADRVVQHVAAHAGMTPSTLSVLLDEQWPHARWLTDLRRAVSMCFAGGDRSELHLELSSEWYSERPPRPWILLIAGRSDDLLALCQLEHERAWITRVFASVSDHSLYVTLINEYTAEAEILDARRVRERNALVHGNPTRFAVVESVREYAEFLSSGALYRALESFMDGSDADTAIRLRTNEFTAMQTGQDAASYWRSVVLDD
jgi:hypothetical protein